MTLQEERLEIALPPGYRTGPRILEVRHEEDALCWLWAFPRLLPWPVAVPFVNYHSAAREEFAATHWRTKWERHLRAELAFPTCVTERPRGKTGGLLPRSNKRAHIRRWPALAQIIDEHIRSAAYREAVQNALGLRESRSDPCPHYLALMVTSGDSPVLTRAGAASAHSLRQRVGEDHVHVVGIQAEVSALDRVVVSVRAEGRGGRASEDRLPTRRRRGDEALASVGVG